ncbi:unnamed protein product [Closterium sp. Naga37s-1]|nr:unnamed protein product [Closterium sp. Naga37s-1]
MAYIWTHTPSLQRSLRRSNSCGELASGHHEHLGVGRSEGERREGVEGGMEVGEQGNGGVGGWGKGSGSGGGWGKGSGSGGGWGKGSGSGGGWGTGSWGGKREVAEAAVAVAGGGRGWGRKGGMWGGFFSGQLGQTQGGFWGGDEQQQRRGGGEEEDSDDSDDFLPPGFSAPLVYSAYEVKTPYLPEPLEAAEAREAQEALEDREHGPVQASCVRPPPADMQRRLVSISDPRDLPFRVPVAASVTTLPSFAEYRAKLALENGAGGGVGRGGGVGASGEKGERMGEGVEGVERVVGRKRGKGRGMRREARGECEKRNVGRGDKGNVEKQKGDKEKGGMENGDNGKGDLKKRDKDKVGVRRRHLVRSFLLPETVSEHGEGESGAVAASAYDASREQAEGASSGEERGNKLIAVEEGEGESGGVEACVYEAPREQAEGASSGEEEEGTTNGLQGCSGRSDCMGDKAVTETL